MPPGRRALGGIFGRMLDRLLRVVKRRKPPALPPKPKVEFSAAKAPQQKAVFDKAVAGGSPTRLTRTTSKSQIRKNRSIATAPYPSPRPAGMSVEEYPYASSFEGGAGASTGLVPKAEQDYQGGVLSSFYQKHGIGHGDQYDVGWKP